MPGQYSPAALSLKMASELNLLETLEESVRQLSEMERSRHVSMAQQESVSLARVLQARQRDHEREIQLLSLKARQEVEEANKQLEVSCRQLSINMDLLNKMGLPTTLPCSVHWLSARKFAKQLFCSAEIGPR